MSKKDIVKVRTKGRTAVVRTKDPVPVDRAAAEIGHKGVIYVKSVNEMMGRLSDVAVAFVQGYFRTVAEFTHLPGEFSIDLEDMAARNNLSEDRCLAAILEVGEYMIANEDGSVYRRLCVPIWIKSDDGGRPTTVVLFAFPVKP